MTVIVPYVQLNITLNCHSPFGGNKMAASQENVLHVIFYFSQETGTFVRCYLLV